jgi:hypothetical protein
MDKNKSVLKSITEILPKETSNSGKPLELRELYIPPAHRKALQIYSNIVVGARGVGKSTWTSALAHQKLRDIIGANISELENASVALGFSENPNPTSHPDNATIKGLLRKNCKPFDIWKAVVIRWLSLEINEPIPAEDWQKSVLWVKDNPEACLKILVKANNDFKSKQKNGLILFDALDRLSGSWEEMDAIARDLLRLILELKGYSNIFTKVFLREDQLSRKITDFPDSSKLLSTKTELNWEIYDLHGLLWQQLCNASDEGGDILRKYYKEIVGTAPLRKDNYWEINPTIKNDIDKQRALFGKLAGPWMGKDKRRGVPYVWSVGHLADGKKRTSPRSFLIAIREAADDSLNRAGNYPLHYESIKNGVQKASLNRVDEIAEDYPWIHDLCKSLALMTVPAFFSDIEKKWGDEYPDGPSTIESKKLPPQDLERGWIGIKKELIRLGIFEEMRDGRINMPDLFRIAFKLGRKGGVRPVE